MRQKFVKITATLPVEFNGWLDRQTIRAGVPLSLYEADSLGQYSVGILVCGTHRGRKIGIAKKITQWDGQHEKTGGVYYEAFNLSDPEQAAEFSNLEEFCREE